MDFKLCTMQLFYLTGYLSIPKKWLYVTGVTFLIIDLKKAFGPLNNLPAGYLRTKFPYLHVKKSNCNVVLKV